VQMLGQRVHKTGALVLSLLMALLGVILVVETVSAGYSVISSRMLIGVLLAAGGVGRLYLEARRGRP
jgi:hypothetical protein